MAENIVGDAQPRCQGDRRNRVEARRVPFFPATTDPTAGSPEPATNWPISGVGAKAPLIGSRATRLPAESRDGAYKTGALRMS